MATVHTAAIQHLIFTPISTAIGFIAPCSMGRGQTERRLVVRMERGALANMREGRALIMEACDDFKPVMLPISKIGRVRVQHGMGADSSSDRIYFR